MGGLWKRERGPIVAVSLVLTFIGADRPGLVELLSKTIADHGGNWLDSRMCSLLGQFAGIILVAAPEGSADRLRGALAALQENGLQVAATEAVGAPAPAQHRRLRLELVGQDRPGIVRDVSRVLRERAVNIYELHSEIISGAMSGETLFRAVAEIQIPPEIAVEQLRGALEALANDIMVDIALKDIGSERTEPQSTRR